jgi:hypothetical protein
VTFSGVLNAFDAIFAIGFDVFSLLAIITSFRHIGGMTNVLFSIYCYNVAEFIDIKLLFSFHPVHSSVRQYPL